MLSVSRRDHWIDLAVSDDGPGIDPDARERIFDPFMQVDSTSTREAPGLGLGLPVCRELARALGGDLHVDGDEGDGARFVLSLPLAPAAAPPGPGAVDPDRPQP